MHRVLLFAALTLAAVAPRAAAGDLGTYRFDPGGAVRAIRVIDMDGDGRRDLVVLVERRKGEREEIVIARTPAAPAARTFFPADHVTRIPCTGPLADAGTVAVGRFGRKAGARLRFLGPRGAVDVGPDGAIQLQTPRLAEPSLLGRSPGQSLIFWDAVADLDGDGADEVWFPLARGDGPIRVLGGTPKNDAVLDLAANNLGASSDEFQLARYAYVPNLFPADLDGDGRRELVALQEETLVAWQVGDRGDATGPLRPSYRLALPFLKPPRDMPAREMRVPRIQLRDVDQDGATDLLVTLLTGNQGNLESLRTILFHYPGPFRDPETGTLRKPLARIDTQSIVLHPLFVDVDRDGDLDYVGDSIRGTRADILARIMGKEPRITFVGFRFDSDKGTFETAPAFTIERGYSTSETLGNTFGRSAWFAGDFDADGTGDMLDLGNLQGAEILRGTKGAGRSGVPLAFEPGLLSRVPVKEGLRADAHVTDLDGDGRDDAVLWSEKAVYLIVPRGER